MSPAVYKRLIAFKANSSKNKHLIINNEIIDDQDIHCLVSLLNGHTHLTALALECCQLNISEEAFCLLIEAIADNENLKVFRLIGEPAGSENKFLVDNPKKLAAVCELINSHQSLQQLGLANIIYNRHYIRKIVDDACNNTAEPIALEFGSVLVDLPRVAAEVDKLNEAAAKAANDKKINTQLNPEKPHKRQNVLEILLEKFKTKLGLLRFNDPKLKFPILL